MAFRLMTPSGDCLLIDPTEFESAFQRWVRSVLPALGQQNVVAIDGKPADARIKIDATALHLVSAFALAPGW